MRQSSACPAVLATATALPRHRYDQATLLELAERLIPELGSRAARLRQYFERVQVQNRYLALDQAAYAHLDGLESKSRAWLEVSLELGQQCIEELLESSQISPGDVGHLMTTTVTGLCVPTLDARLMNRLPLPKHMKRVPAFGLGCVGGAAGIARVADYLLGHPTEAGILLSTELCSLTMQRGDLSPGNLISMALFGDGAAAVLLVGAEHPMAKGAGPRVVDSESVFFPNTERLMGWEVVDSGFRVVLDERVPELARTELRPALEAFLARHDLSIDAIQSWVCHPGGPKVMDAVAEGLGLDGQALEPARAGLATFGNLSSGSVLFLLDEFRRRRRPPPGSPGILMAMGPAFCAELVLLEW